MITAFPKIITADRNLQLIQANIEKTFSNLQTSPFLNGNLLTDIVVSTSATTIPHGLSRTPQIWVLCDQNTNTIVWRSAMSDDVNIYLIAGSTCTVDIWVS